MRKFRAIAAIVLAAALGAGAAEAQVRINPIINPQIILIPRVPRLPRVQPQVPHIQQPNVPNVPNLVVIPPSNAIQRALGTAPGAKLLGVKMRNQIYVGRLKQGGTITQLGVDSVTGAVTPLP